MVAGGAWPSWRAAQPRRLPQSTPKGVFFLSFFAQSSTPLPVSRRSLQTTVSGKYPGNTAKLLNSLTVCASQVYVVDTLLIPAASLDAIPATTGGLPPPAPTPAAAPTPSPEEAPAAAAPSPAAAAVTPGPAPAPPVLAADGPSEAPVALDGVALATGYLANCSVTLGGAEGGDQSGTTDAAGRFSFSCAGGCGVAGVRAGGCCCGCGRRVTHCQATDATLPAKQAPAHAPPLLCPTTATLSPAHRPLPLTPPHPLRSALQAVLTVPAAGQPAACLDSLTGVPPLFDLVAYPSQVPANASLAALSPLTTLTAAAVAQQVAAAAAAAAPAGARKLLAGGAARGAAPARKLQQAGSAGDMAGSFGIAEAGGVVGTSYGDPLPAALAGDLAAYDLLSKSQVGVLGRPLGDVRHRRPACQGSSPR